MSTSKKYKPNKLTILRNELGEVFQKIKDKIPTEIKEEEKHLYHVLLLKPYQDKAGLTMNYGVSIQTFNVRSWEASKKRLIQVGYKFTHILHDPTLKVEEEEPKKKSKKGNKAKGPKPGPSTDKVEEEDEEEDDNQQTPQEYRNQLIQEAKELGYEGALNVKNTILEEFIESAKENGENDKD